MTEQQEYLIQILSDFVNERYTEIRNIDILDVAYCQQVTGIVYHQTKNPALKSNQYFELYCYLNRNRMNSELEKAIDVPYCFVKGMEIAKYYPIPQLRTMGDTDIVIRPEDTNRLHEIMLAQGFECVSEGIDDSSYVKEKFSVEVHKSMIHYHKGNETLAAYFNNLWNHGEFENHKLILDINFHFMYILQHLSGHLAITGVGIRQFMDIAIIVKNVKLDWKYIERELKKLSLWDFCKMTLGFCKRAFNLETEYNIPESLYEATIDKIFKDGVFGHDNEENKELKKESIALLYEKKQLTTIKKMFRSAFPPYDYLIIVSYLTYLRGRKYLLPIAWGHRAIYQLFFNSQKSKRKLFEGIDKDKLKSKSEFLKDWGLG